MTTFARFAASPIGVGLLVEDGGLSLATSGPTSLQHAARSDVAQSVGAHGCEVVLWGEDDAQATLGVVIATASVDAEVGNAGGVGWRLHTGQVVVNGAVVASGLPLVKKGEIAGVRVSLSGSRTIEFYRGAVLVHSRALPLAGSLHFAMSLASTEAGGLRCIVNAGQWQGASNAVLQGGWEVPGASITPLWLGAEHYMSATSDTPANQPFVGCVADNGLDAVASVSFWPWDSGSRAGTGTLRIDDADGLLDAAALGDMRDAPVRLRLATQGAPLADAAPISRYVLERIDIEGDGRKSIVLRDPHDDLDNALHQAVFLPSINDQIAWQPQPVVIGAVRSVPTIPVNSDGSVRWVSDAAVASVARVLDRGAEIIAGDGYALVAGAQQLAFDAQPVGPVIADVSSIGPAMQPATLQQALRDVFRRVRKSAWAADDAAAIDSATGYAGIGYYAGEGATARQALAEILPSYCVDWWPDGDGVLRLARLIDPDSVPEVDLAFNLDWRVLAGDLIVKPDLAPGLSRRMAYQPNATQLASGDMITDLEQLPPSERQQLAGAYRGQVYAGGPLAPRYNRAEAAAPVLSRFDKREDAQAELDRVIALYAVPRHFYSGLLACQPELAFRPGQIGRISYPRYGLAGGRNVIVTSVITNPVSGRHSIRFWGA